MKKNIIRVVLVLAVGFVGLAPTANGERPTWARKAIAFQAVCRDSSEFHKCKSLRIPSPDNKSSVEVVYERDKDMMFSSLRLTTPGRGIREVQVPWGNDTDELLWSPNSKAFFINCGCGSSIAGFAVGVYLVDSANIDVGLDFTLAARQDMVRSFPPCKALNHDPGVCEDTKADGEDWNMSGIDWLEDSSGIVVMSEVPPTSLWGGIMGQVMGYELEVPSGKILRRINAKQFRVEWQKSMAWKFRIPDPPDYE